MILYGPCKSGVAEWCPYIYPPQFLFYKSMIFCKSLPPPSQGGDGGGGRILQGVQAHVPLRPGMKYSRKGKPLTPIKVLSIEDSMRGSLSELKSILSSPFPPYRPLLFK